MVATAWQVTNSAFARENYFVCDPAADFGQLVDMSINIMRRLVEHNSSIG